MLNDLGSVSIAWRLFAALEVCCLVLITSALAFYRVRTRLTRKTAPRTINSVLINNASSLIGQLVINKLKSRGCAVHTPLTAATNASTNRPSDVDAIIVIGADASHGLNGLSRLVSEDVYHNLKFVESMAPAVRRGGYIVWASGVGGAPDTYTATTQAFDAVLRTSLRHISKISHCQSIWVSRSDTHERAAAKVIDVLFPDGSRILG